MLFWLMRGLRTGSWVRDALATAAATAMAFSLALNAWLWIHEKVVWIQQTGTPPSFEAFEVFPWETANVMPVLVLLTVPFIAWVPLKPVRVVLWLVVGASALVLVPFSVGRAGWLAIALATVLYVQLRTNVAGRLLARVGSRGARIGLLVAGGLAALAAVVVVAVPIIRGLSGERPPPDLAGVAEHVPGPTVRRKWTGHLLVGQAPLSAGGWTPDPGAADP